MRTITLQIRLGRRNRDIHRAVREVVYDPLVDVLAREVAQEGWTSNMAPRSFEEKVRKIWHHQRRVSKAFRAACTAGGALWREMFKCRPYGDWVRVVVAKGQGGEVRYYPLAHTCRTRVCPHCIARQVAKVYRSVCEMDADGLVALRWVLAATPDDAALREQMRRLRRRMTRNLRRHFPDQTMFLRVSLEPGSVRGTFSVQATALIGWRGPYPGGLLTKFAPMRLPTVQPPVEYYRAGVREHAVQFLQFLLWASPLYRPERVRELDWYLRVTKGLHDLRRAG